MSRPAATSSPTANEGKQFLLPTLRFSAFHNDQGWAERPLSELLTESRVPGSGGDVARKLTVKLWGKGVTHKTDVRRGSENTQYYRRRAGQFIYSKLDFLNQAFGVIPPELDGFESTVDLPCFDVSESLNAKFLLEYVQRDCFYRRHGELADGGRKAKRIQVESLLSFKIALPEKPAEQEKIADCLTSLDEVIAAQGRKVEALKAHKKGLMQHLFPEEGQTLPRLRFPEFRDGPEWETAKIGRILEKSAKPATLDDDAHYREIGVRSHGKGLFHKDPTTGKAIGSKRVFHVVPDALVINIVFAWEQALAVTTEAEAGFIASHRFPMFVPRSRRCDVAFMQRLFLMPVGKQMLKVASPGGAGRNRTLSQTEFENLDVIVPGTPEQQRIADCLSILDTRLAAEAARLDALKAHKKGLMQGLFPSAISH